MHIFAMALALALAAFGGAGLGFILDALAGEEDAAPAEQGEADPAG